MNPFLLTLLTVGVLAASIAAMIGLTLWALKREAPYRYDKAYRPHSLLVWWTERNRRGTMPFPVMIAISTFLAGPLIFAYCVNAYATSPLGKTARLPSVSVRELPVEFHSDTWAAECEVHTASGEQRTYAGTATRVNYTSFTGAEDLWCSPEGARETLTLEYSIAAEGGRADLALVYPDGTVTRLSGERSPYLFSPPEEGSTVLRLIGDGGRQVQVTFAVSDSINRKGDR